MAFNLPTSEEELQAAIAEATKGIRAELTAERDKRSESEKLMKETAATLSEIKAEKEKTAADAEKKDLEAKGEYQKALDKAKEAYEKKLAELTVSITDRDSLIDKLMIEDRLLAFVSGKTVDGKERQVVRLIQDEYKFTRKGNEILLTTSDGKPLLGDNGQAMTMGGVCDKFMGDNLHFAKPGAISGGSGIRTVTPALAQTGGDNADAKIAEAVKNYKENPSLANRQLVVKLKAQKQSLQGPHSLLQSKQKSGG